MAVILDADVFAPGDQVEAAVKVAVDTGRLTLGFTMFEGLTPHMTERVLQGYEGPYDKGVRFKSDVHESSIVVVPRKLWQELGGFDDRFVGWGQEDVAFCHAARLIGGGIERVPGTVYHLWHPRSQYRHPGLASYQAAQALGARYRSCSTDEDVRSLLTEPRRAPVVDPFDMAKVQRSLVFQSIYRDNAWNGVETRSGPGSGTEATTDMAKWLVKVCKELKVKSVLDAGCGEGAWQPKLPGYVGVDIVAEAIGAARVRHPERRWVIADICSDILPATDAVLCRDALQHLSLSDAQAAVSNFRRAGASYLIGSSHAGEVNRNVPTGSWYPCNLQAAPFWFGEPVTQVFDGHWEGRDHHPGKFLGAWEL